MFQRIYYRLLFSYLGVLTFTLGTFAIAIRVAFIYNMKQQITDKLTLLGRSAAVNVRLEGDRLKLENLQSVQNLMRQDQALQWFNSRRELITQQGKATIASPLLDNAPVQIQENNDTYIQAVTLPIISGSNSQVIGYVRASQSLEERDSVLGELDWGLGSGMVIALVLSGIGGFVLTRQAMQPVEKSYQRLKQFTADASHELRSPLMAIKASAQVAMRHPEAMRPDDAEEFQTILLAADQMTRLTEDLLLLARDTIPCQSWNTVDLAALLESLVKQYQSQAIAQSIHLSAQITHPLHVFGNSSELTRLFRNLLDNALYYTSSSGSVEIRASRIASQISASIQDTGIGIAPEHLEHIFERFWRADQSRSHKDGKSGLGLAISKIIAEQHNGSITVTSQFGDGSCFTVRLPSATSDIQ